MNPSNRIAILAYHSVSDAPAGPIAPFTVSRAAFARQLDLVAGGGHPVLTIAELVERLRGNWTPPPGTVAITFDDGFEDNLTVAAPLLQERRLPATAFVTTGFLGGGGMLSREQLGELESAGFEVGSHAHTHRPLDVLTRAEARAEIGHSKRLLEAALGHPVTSFAYPHGYASRAVEEEVQRGGFQSACGVTNAFSHPGDNRWHLARLTVTASTSIEQVGKWLSGTGAPVASHERLRTMAWREARRARECYERGSSLAAAAMRESRVW